MGVINMAIQPQLGLVKVLDVPQNFCFRGTAGDILQQIAAALAVQIPSTITNVEVGNEEPVDIQNIAIWVRQDNAGNFIGLYVVDGGKWVPASYNWKDFDPDPQSTMTLTDKVIYNARYCINSASVSIELYLRFTIGGTVSTNFTVQLPVPGKTSTVVGMYQGNACTIFPGGGNAGEAGFYRIASGSSKLELFRSGAGNYAVGTVAGVRVSLTYEIDL
jgi:hypothetical protein